MEISSAVLVLFILIGVCTGDSGVRYLQFHYEAEVVARYGRTRITSVVRNDVNESQLLEYYQTPRSLQILLCKSIIMVNSGR